MAVCFFANNIKKTFDMFSFDKIYLISNTNRVKLLFFVNNTIKCAKYKMLHTKLKKEITVFETHF